MRAILVCVDYSDYLAITLPYNRHHFEQVCVVTAPHDTDTIELAQVWKTSLVITNSFYDDGADFNKFKAMEQGLDVFGRHGLMCIMDADVLWPKHIPLFEYKKGCLYTPYRRMFPDMSVSLPQEAYWKFFEKSRCQDFSGYTQIFHAEDPVLNETPWHQTNWRHAGGADTFFNRKWRPENKIRPPFEVFHLGPHGVNWCGRSSDYLDGRKVEGGQERKNTLDEYMRRRRKGGVSFNHEKTTES